MGKISVELDLSQINQRKECLMTPFVELQQQIIAILFRMRDRNPAFLQRWLDACKKGFNLSDDDWRYLRSEYQLVRPTEDWMIEDLPRIIIEQIDESTSPPTIRNLLGSPLYKTPSYGLKEQANKDGSGECRLRTKQCAQPGALVKGDVLLTGETLLTEPREGGNGAVLIHLSGREHGTWLSLPARIAIALKT